MWFFAHPQTISLYPCQRTLDLSVWTCISRSARCRGGAVRNLHRVEGPREGVATPTALETWDPH